MNIKIEDINETRKKLLATVGAEEVEQEYEKVVKDFAKIARLPGFRPGKAPVQVVARRFAKEVSEEVSKNLIGKAYRDSIEQNKLEPMTMIEGPETGIERGKDNSVTFVVDIRPDFELPSYRGIQISRASDAATEEDIDKVIDSLRQQRADYKPVEREAKDGDYVRVSYEGKVDDQPIEEVAPDNAMLAKQTGTWDEVGSDIGPVPGLAPAFAGMKPGDKKDVPITFPNDFPVEQLRDKTATYSVEVLEVRERELPELNDEFVSSLGAENMEQLREHVGADIVQQKRDQIRSKDRQQVTEALTQAVEFPLPESIVERETEILLRQFMEEHLRRGVPQEEFEKRKDELYDGASRGGRHRVKTRLILAKIAEAEKITVDEKDISRYVYFEAQRRHQKPEQLVRELQQKPEEVDAIKQGIVMDKTLDFLVENASVTQTDSN